MASSAAFVSCAFVACVYAALVVSGDDTAVNKRSPVPVEVRLVGGASPSAGRVELRINGTWGTVCDDSPFDDDAARVVCRMLGYTSVNPVVYDNAHYGEGTGPILLDNVDCDGDEDHILRCGHDGIGVHNCGHYEDVGVDCRPSTDVPLEVRLVGGASPSAGRVELRINGTWGTVCDDSPFDDDAARVVCRMLGYTSVNPVVYDNAHYGEGTGPILLDNVDCDGDEDHILRCGHDGIGVHNCGHYEDVGVDCRPSTDVPVEVRLVGGASPSAGRVELRIHGTWGTVCDDSPFDYDAARVVCRMLGYTSVNPVVYDNAHYGEGTGPILLDNVDCDGDEDHILRCGHDGIGVHNCGHYEDVGVDCRPSTDVPVEVRLVGGASPSAGRVELRINGTWGTVCDDSPFDDDAARVVCRMLGYTSVNPVVYDNAHYGEGTGPILLDNVDCDGDEDHILRCGHDGIGVHNCGHYEDVGVDCRPSTDVPLEVRLVGGASPSAGRVELRINGVWGTVCDDSPFDDDAARVVCRMLGYTSVNPVVYDNAHYGEGTGPILLDEVDCDGDEDHILRCGNDGIGVHNCDHDEDVGVDCRP